MTTATHRRVQFGRFGLSEDPIGLDVTWKIGPRTYLARVVGAYRLDRGLTMLKTRFFCGDQAPDVAASAVHVLVRTYDGDAEDRFLDALVNDLTAQDR